LYFFLTPDHSVALHKTTYQHHIWLKERECRLPLVTIIYFQHSFTHFKVMEVNRAGW